MIAVTVDGGSIYPLLAALVNVRFAGLLEKMRASMSIDACSVLVCWPTQSMKLVVLHRLLVLLTEGAMTQLQPRRVI